MKIYNQIILQNIAARHPGLSGHVRSRPSDHLLRYILAVRFASILLHFPTSCRHTDADLRACFMRGPLVGERTASHCSIFRPAWRETRWLGHGYARPPGAKESFHVSFPAGRTVERTTPYARGNRGFIAGYRTANVAGHLLFLWAGELRAGTPRQLLLSIFFSPLPKSLPYPLPTT
jgi:hypothetical protein